MKSVAKNYMRVYLFEFKRAHGLNGAISAYRHKGGRFYLAVRERYCAAAGKTILFVKGILHEVKLHSIATLFESRDTIINLLEQVY
jgi:hypothetical protein